MIHHLLEQTCADSPEKTAIICGEEKFSYSRLNRSSNQLANFLSANGVEPGDRIGIFSNKCPEEIIAIFAILKVGAIFVHINPQFREKQLFHLLSDCEIKALFVDAFKSGILKKAYPVDSPLSFIIGFSDLSQLLNFHGTVLFSLSDILRSSSENNPPEIVISEDSTASLVYTSGSSGLPKGVVVSHRIFKDATTISASVLNNSHEDRLISATPFSFDGALSQMFTAFLVGATIVLQQSNFPKDIVKTLLQHKITGFHAVPSLWALLFQKHSPFAKNTYPDLRYISIIGEALSQNQLNCIRTVLPNTKIYIMYGTTEAFRSTYLPPEDLDRKPGSVGIPFPGVKIKIVDAKGRACPPGQVGEIVHGGAFISPGYWNRSVESNSPFKNGVYHTGDLGKTDKDGYLYFIGRKDGQIKTSGYRVSPEEVEQCIYEIEDISETAVFGVPNKETNSEIIAIVVTKQGKVVRSQDVIRHCKSRIPAYMVPRRIIFYDAFPKTSSHKINRPELIRQVTTKEVGI